MPAEHGLRLDEESSRASPAEELALICTTRPVAGPRWQGHLEAKCGNLLTEH